MQTQGCNWALAEYYDRVLRQLNDSKAAKGAWGQLGPSLHVDGPQKFLLAIALLTSVAEKNGCAKPSRDSAGLKTELRLRQPAGNAPARRSLEGCWA